MCVSSRYNVQIHEEKFIKFINGDTNSILGYTIVKWEGFQVVLMITPTPKDAKYVLRIRCAFLASVLCSVFITSVLNTDYFLIKCMWDKKSE